MLFLKGEKEQGVPRAVYLLNDDMEAMIQTQVALRLAEQGYPTSDRSEVVKDMTFLRAKRQLVEQLGRQLWSLLLRGVVIGLGALILLGIEGYLAI